MGCEANCRQRELNDKENIPNPEYENYRKYSSSTNISEDENNSENNMNNHQNKIPNIQENNQKEINNEIPNFDEEKARNLVKYLLENDISIYKDLISVVDNLSSYDFQKLFEGNFEHNYSSKNQTQLKRLSHKFDNFYYILINCYKKQNLYDYLKELWIYYPYIDDLKNMKDKKKISSKLSSTLPNYKSWPNNIQQELITAIVGTEYLSNKKIIEKIKDESVEIDKILRKLATIQKTFSTENNDEEYLLKNNNVLGKDLEFIYDSVIKNFDGKKNKLTKKDKENIQKHMIQEKNDYNRISPYLQNNTNLIFDTIFSLAIKKIGLPNDCASISEMKDTYSDEGFGFGFGWDDDEDNLDKIEDRPEEKNNEELMEWMALGKNFVICVDQGIQMFQTINLSKKIMDKEKNEYRIRLNTISEQFNEYQNSKRLYENDPIENLKIIKDSINNIEKIRKDLFDLINDLKKEIDKHVNRKKGIIGNIVYQVIKIGTNIFTLAVTKNPTKLINLLNIGIEITNIAFSRTDLSYTNDIIDELIKILEEAIKKKKDVDNEINKLNENFQKIRNGYPTYYK